MAIGFIEKVYYVYNIDFSIFTSRKIKMLWKNIFKSFQKTFFSLINLGCYLNKRSKQDHILQISAALAYTFLVGLVPLLAIALAVFSAFPVFESVKEQLQTLIFENFAPHTGDTLRAKIADFVTAASGLTALGTVGLALTSVFMLNKIEDAFNIIFRVHKPRSLLARIMMYWTILTFSPLLLGASFSFSGYVDAFKNWFYQETSVSETDLNFIIPLIFFALGFMFLYLVVPNRSVKIKPALIGGIFAALLFNLLKFLFGYFVLISSSYQVIYGALAALPLFLLWIYLSWAIVLLGAEIAAALPEWSAGDKFFQDNKPVVLKNSAKLVAAAILLIESLWQSSKKSYTAKKTAHFNLSKDEFDFIVQKLKESHLIALTENHELVLIREPASFTVLELAEIFGVTGDCKIEQIINSPHLAEKIRKILTDAQKAAAKHLAVPIIDVLN